LKIAVLGAAGGMGRWLVQYFAGQGHFLTVSDVRRDEAEAFAKTHGAEFAKNNLEAVKEAESVVVSVPIDKTAAVLYEVAPHLRKNTIIAEISSIKSNIVDVLAEISQYGVQPLSLHPLFGPSMRRLKKKVALIPVLNVEEEKKLAERIFPDAKIVVVNAKQHDKAMAVTLSIPYFINMTLASILGGEDITILKKLSGTTFTLQLTLMGSIMAQSSELHVTMHMANEYASDYLKKFLLEAEKLRALIEKRDVKKFCRFYDNLQKNLSKNLDLMDLYGKMYTALEALE